MTVKELREHLGRYPEDYLVIMNDPANNGEIIGISGDLFRQDDFPKVTLDGYMGL